MVIFDDIFWATIFRCHIPSNIVKYCQKWSISFDWNIKKVFDNYAKYHQSLWLMKCYQKMPLVNPFASEADIIWKPVSWFAKQINGLVSVWYRPPTRKVKQVWRESSILKHKLKIKIVCTFTGYNLKWLCFADLPAILSLQYPKCWNFERHWSE